MLAVLFSEFVFILSSTRVLFSSGVMMFV